MMGMKNANANDQSAPNISLSVLYCEDTALSRVKLARFLGPRVSQLHLADDGISGLELFEKHRPDLVISDISMPGMDGITMCRAIRKIDPTVRIMLVSVHEKAEYLHAAIDLCVDKYLKKPLDFDLLLTGIESIAADLQQQKLLASKLDFAQKLVHKALHEQEKANGSLDTRFKHIQQLGLIRRISLPRDTLSHDAHVVVQHDGSQYLLVADGPRADHVDDRLSAEMLTLQLPKLFKSLAEEDLSLPGIAQGLNQLLLQRFSGYHVAATLVHLDQEGDAVEVLNCSNPPALLIDESGTCVHTFRTAAPALGTRESRDFAFEMETVPARESGRLYLYTDGLTDILQADDATSLIASAFDAAQGRDTFEHVEQSLKQALSARAQRDDITLLELPLAPAEQAEHIVFPRLVRPAPRDKLLSCIDSLASDFSEIRVLYIGKQEGSRASLQALLDSHIGDFYSASDSEQALALFSEHAPSVVIADLAFLKSMPACTINDIHRLDPSASVILLNESGEIVGSPMELPCFGAPKCVNQPVDMENVFQSIRRARKQCCEQQHIQLSAATYFHSSLAMTITSNNREIVSVNPAFCRITGYHQDEVIGRNPNILSSGKHDADFYRQMWHSINTRNEWSGEIWNKRKNGELFLEWITINAITDEHGEVTHYFSVFADVTERKAAEEAVRKLTYHDPLTDLPNRRLFLERLEQEINKAEQQQQLLAVLFVDIDNLKDVNDTLGHDCGDQVISETARRLRDCVRDTDTVARFGGDEFTLFLTELRSVGNADTVAQHILKAMTTPIELNEEQFYLSVSIGIAMYPDDASTIPDLLKHADQAMFSAKFSGRNRVRYFDASMQAQALAKKELIKELRKAIGTHQFSVYFQPIVEMNSGAVNKAEALIRWQHPERGFISPREFIPLAEDSGMISEIGDWVFRQAVLQAKKWQIKYDRDLQISINKSPKQFQSKQQVHEDWINFLNDIDLPESSIVIEITEGLLMDTSLANSRQLLMFRDAGIGVALDDFGTGYSSLAYLKKFDIDYLKIDREFIQNLAQNSDDQALCEAIIVMAHRLGLRVIAEGVETEQQRQILLAAGCDYGQGYLFSKPLPADEFEKLLGGTSLSN